LYCACDDRRKGGGGGKEVVRVEILDLMATDGRKRITMMEVLRKTSWISPRRKNKVERKSRMGPKKHGKQKKIPGKQHLMQTLQVNTQLYDTTRLL
jgi:hypothetical protein